MPHKRALLVGINQYHPVIGPLAGCLNDVRQVRNVLLERFSFPEEEIMELCDFDATRDAILVGLDWLINDAEVGDVRIWYYSGHGTRLPNLQDPSGKDEVLVAFSPVWETLLAGQRDASLLFREENQQLQFIRDKEIKTKLERVQDGVNLTLVMDCCHSGDVNRDVRTFPRYLEPPAELQTAINLAQQAYWTHVYETTPEARLDELKLNREQAGHLWRKVFSGNRFDFVDTQEKSILLAACSESETAIEKSFNGQRGGVFTHYLIEAISEHGRSVTYDGLIRSAGDRMRFTALQMPRLTCPVHHCHQTVFSPFQ